MPYTIKKVGRGYKVCKKRGTKCFSKKPFHTKKEAIGQMAAIRINESNSVNLIAILNELIK
jgi:hypothetical protein